MSSSALCALLQQQLRAITTSFTRTPCTSKPHAHLLVLLLRLINTSLSCRFYAGPPHTALSSCLVCTRTCLIQFSSRPSLKLFHRSFLSRIRIHVYLPQLITCRTYVSSVRSTTRLLSFTDSHVIDAWVHMPPERFCPYSLLSGTSTRTTNRTSFLVLLWYSTNPYAPIASSRTLWCLPPRNRVTLFSNAQASSPPTEKR